MTNEKRYSSVSIGLIALSAAVALLSSFGDSQAALQLLFIANPGRPGLQDILSGQVWRLITPIFIHFGIMHFVFNMMWVWDLGKTIETRNGMPFYVAFVAVVGAVSNLAQYLLAGSPFFGGMSGVVYGLFGYIWIRGRTDPGFGAALHKTTVIMMLAWFALCWTGLLGPIANWAHTVGLVLGAAWACFGSMFNKSSVPVQAIASSAEDRIEYLSTTDMLQIEAQRQWVRDHYLPARRNEYDTVAGKLDIIHTIISQMVSGPADAKHVKSLDIAFGDALVQETGARWATLQGKDGRAAVLVFMASHGKRLPDASLPEQLSVFPLVTITQHMHRNQPFDTRQVFDETVQRMRLSSL